MNSKILLAKTSLVLALFILIPSGCEDRITQPSEFANNNLLLRQYSASNINSFNQYFYNASNKIVTIESHGNTGLERRSEFYYDDRDNLVKESVYHTYYGGPEHYYLIHEYDELGLLEKTSAYLLMRDGTYEFRSTTTYEYDSNKRITFENLHDTDGTKTQHWELFYDSNGNVVEMKQYFKEKLIFDDKYEYDNKNNPLKLTSVHVEAQNLSTNNMLGHTQTNYSMNDADYTHIYTYEYNENDYPISCTCTLDSTRVLYRILYEYYQNR